MYTEINDYFIEKIIRNETDRYTRFGGIGIGVCMTFINFQEYDLIPENSFELRTVGCKVHIFQYSIGTIMTRFYLPKYLFRERTFMNF